MAVYEASKVRSVCIELNEKVFDLYAALLPIVTALNDWTLNGVDPALPQPFDVRIQLEAYEALTKSALRLTDWVTALKAATVYDTLTYPTPPVFFDGGTGLFDGGGDPNA
jgi:hypothetical protein